MAPIPARPSSSTSAHYRDQSRARTECWAFMRHGGYKQPSAARRYQADFPSTFKTEKCASGRQSRRGPRGNPSLNVATSLRREGGEIAGAARSAAARAEAHRQGTSGASPDAKLSHFDAKCAKVRAGIPR
ncbi:hypothetical protein K523DRAFT_359219 [Schizophyllum commune Tattone D]|nr:hypothetical protein K523DRAFT_359219 [Schizophyllum commune Tattone D]